MTAANIGKQVAMVLDDYVISAPVVQSEITGGGTSITGDFRLKKPRTWPTA